MRNSHGWEREEGRAREGEGGRLAAAPAQDHALEEEVQENRKDGACTLRPL